MFDEAKIRTAVASIIEAIGENPQREGLADTPKRVAEMYAELFMGINIDPKEELSVIFGKRFKANQLRIVSNVM
ncbi:unnamed protein product [marine sediment metagenome]|uniref:GTP cyclohydrolase I domain-containing protein n=1 Tax=marine sediment metagenome TaxID=412755 RepID=X1PSM0_9ZZZZ